MLFNPLLQIAAETWGAIICFLFAVFILMSAKKEDDNQKYLMLMVSEIAIILISDSMAIYYRGDISTFGYYIVRISNYLCFCFNCIIELSAGMLLKSLIGDKDHFPIKSWSKIISIICLFHIVIVTASQFNNLLYYFDENNRYHRGPLSIVNIITTFSIVVILLCVLLYNYKQIKSLQINAILYIFVSTICAEIVQMCFYGISLTYISLAVGILVLLLSYQRENALRVIEAEKELMDNKLQIMQQQQELADKRSKLMLSQIQPHFIFNTLSAISTLCLFDPESAKETTDNFATYLRRNLDSLGEVDLIPFTQELEHVKAYLAIEKVRFEDELEVEYDIQFEHFMIPPLTLQPMVENAVKHGLRGKENGGTVHIETRLSDDQIIITIKDDGIGFEMGTVKNDGKTHVGIENVSERIRLLCNGTATIESKIGAGTKVTIQIPVEG